MDLFEVNERVLLTTSSQLEAPIVASCRGFHFVFLLSNLLLGAMCHVRATPPGRQENPLWRIQKTFLELLDYISHEFMSQNTYIYYELMGSRKYTVWDRLDSPLQK